MNEELNMAVGRELESLAALNSGAMCLKECSSIFRMEG